MDPYSVRFDERLRLVAVTVTGSISRSLGEEIITRARTLAAAHQCGVLYDVRQADPGFSVTQAFFVPRQLPVLQEARTRGLRAAILTRPPGGDRVYEFYEDVTTNLGLSVKVFIDEDEAIRWLTQAPST